MQKYLNQIDKLTETIKMGLLTKTEALNKLKSLHNEIKNKYELGSDKYTMLLYPLIDANEIANNL